MTTKTLTQFIDDLGIYRKDMAEKLGVHFATLWRWEKGKIQTPYRVRERIKQEFGVIIEHGGRE